MLNNRLDSVLFWESRIGGGILQVAEGLRTYKIRRNWTESSAVREYAATIEDKFGLISVTCFESRNEAIQWCERTERVYLDINPDAGH
jgi:hypothetical protein